MTKNIIFIFVVILLAFSIWKYSADKKKNMEDHDINQIENDIYNVPDHGEFKDEWRIFEDETGGYKIKYPADWLIESKVEKDEMIRADIAQGQRAGLQIRKTEYKSDNFNSFLDSYLDKFKDEMTSHWKGEFSDEQRSVENRIDHNFSRITFRFTTTNGAEWVFIEYIWQKDTTVIAFQCGLEYDSKDKYLPVFDSISDSFEWM